MGRLWRLCPINILFLWPPVSKIFFTNRPCICELRDKCLLSVVVYSNDVKFTMDLVSFLQDCKIWLGLDFSSLGFSTHNERQNFGVIHSFLYIGNRYSLQARNTTSRLAAKGSKRLTFSLSFLCNVQQAMITT